MKIERYVSQMISPIELNTIFNVEILLDQTIRRAYRELKESGGIGDGGIVITIATGPRNGETLPDVEAYK